MNAFDIQDSRALEFDSKEFSLLKALFVAILSCTLNDLIFYYYNLSVLFSLFLVFLFIFLLFKNRYFAFNLVIFVGFILNTRPRELHLIDITTRGNYEYFSPNMLKFAGVTISTWMIFLCFAVVIYCFIRKNKIPKPVFFISILTLVILGFAGALTNPQVSIKYFISDLKYPLFLFLGFYFFYFSFDKRNQASVDNVIKLVVFLGIVLGLMSTIYLIRDAVLFDFKLKYNVSVFYSIVALVTATVFLKGGSLKSWLILVIILIGSVPVTRGEQLALFLSFIISIAMGMKYREKKRVGYRILLLVSLLIMGMLALFVVYPSFVEFFLRKLMFFISGDVGIDKSSSVRVLEMQAILELDNFGDLYRILFGSGFSGYFVFDNAEFILKSLDLADFPADQMSELKFMQPHFFLTYWILKYGLFGSIIIVSLYIPKNLSFGDKRSVLLIAGLFCFLWQGYWAPIYAFWAGAVIALSHLEFHKIKLTNEKN